MSVVLCPLQIVTGGLIVTTGLFTVTVTISLDDPQMSVIVRVYVVLVVGPATGFWQVVQLSPVDGDHTKVPAPLPSNVVLLPLQIVTSFPALAEGDAGVVIVITSVAVPQLLLTVRV